MSDVSSLSVALPRSTRHREFDAAPLDLAATHRFFFVRRRWLTGAGKLVHASLMLATGIFLMSQASSTPNLVLQIAIVGTLLTIGGVIVLAYAWSDFVGRLTVDQRGIRATLGWSGFTVDWPNVASWKINDEAAKIPDLYSVEIWTAESRFPLTVDGGRLSAADHHRLRLLFLSFAERKENG